MVRNLLRHEAQCLRSTSSRGHGRARAEGLEIRVRTRPSTMGNQHHRAASQKFE